MIDEELHNGLRWLHQPQPPRKPTPAHRVAALLRFPFSPAIRELTIQNLLDDPETHALTLAALNKSSPASASY